MKSKTLLIAAAALAAGIMTSQAQVYSQNIVGYINVTIPANENVLIANQLDYDGTGTNNTLATVFPNGVPNNSTIQAWNGTGFVGDSYSTSTGWAVTSNPFINASIQPGVGFFFKTKNATNITFVGNVLVGTNTLAVGSGTTVISPAVPVAGTLDTTNSFPIANNNVVQVWNPSTSGFTGYSYSTTTGWVPSDPQLTVGQSVFINVKKAATWTEILNVQ
jgi:hypothetical protein